MNNELAEWIVKAIYDNLPVDFDSVIVEEQ